ncbi:MAG: hypothetical protein AAGU74_00965 [Bacillota bacterium]
MATGAPQPVFVSENRRVHGHGCRRKGADFGLNRRYGRRPFHREGDRRRAWNRMGIKSKKGKRMRVAAVFQNRSFVFHEFLTFFMYNNFRYTVYGESFSIAGKN